MSAPAADFRNANFLSYGFLATRAEKAAKLLQAGEALSASDAEALQAATDFMNKVSSGATYLISGAFQSNDLVGALDALNLAIDPIQTLSDRIKGNEIGKLFADVAQTVTRATQNPSTPMSVDDKTQIQLFQAFFDALYRYVSSELERETPVIGSPSAGELFRPVSA